MLASEAQGDRLPDRGPSRRRVAIIGTRYDDFSIEEEVLSPLGVEVRGASVTEPREVVAEARGAEVILAGSSPRFDQQTLAALDCRAIVRYGVGTETVDLRAAADRGMWVANVPDYGTEAVAFHTVSLVLAAIRKLPQADGLVKSGAWGLGPLRPLRLPGSMASGVVGYGRIGRRTAALLAALGFRVLAHDPVAPVPPDDRGVRPAGMDSILEECDVVTLHAPGSPDATPLIGEAELGRMKQGSVLVNTARGSLIDQPALIRGLVAGRPAMAALDVFASEPPDPQAFSQVSDRVILTPHMAWYTEETEADLRRKAAEEARRILLGEPPLHPVVAPGGGPR